MNYDDRNDDEENLIYEESPPDFSDKMSIYEPENTDEDSESADETAPKIPVFPKNS